MKVNATTVTTGIIDQPSSLMRVNGKANRYSAAEYKVELGKSLVWGPYMGHIVGDLRPVPRTEHASTVDLYFEVWDSQ